MWPRWRRILSILTVVRDNFRRGRNSDSWPGRSPLPCYVDPSAFVPPRIFLQNFYYLYCRTFPENINVIISFKHSKSLNSFKVYVRLLLWQWSIEVYFYGIELIFVWLFRYKAKGRRRSKNRYIIQRNYTLINSSRYKFLASIYFHRYKLKTFSSLK